MRSPAGEILHRLTGVLCYCALLPPSRINLPSRSISEAGSLAKSSGVLVVISTAWAAGDPVFCTLWTLTGLPAVNLPLLAGTDDLPIGVRLVGASGRDERLLRTACELVRMVAEEG